MGDQPTFDGYQTRRDLGAVCLGCGGLGIVLSAILLVGSLVGGYGGAGWLVYWIGPGALLIAVPLLLAGRRLARAAHAYRERLEERS